MYCHFYMNGIDPWCVSFLSLHKDIFSLLLEREEAGRERNVDVREKHQFVVSCICPYQGSNLQTRHVPWLGTEPTTFPPTERHSNQLNHTSQGNYVCFEQLFWKKIFCFSCWFYPFVIITYPPIQPTTKPLITNQYIDLCFYPCSHKITCIYMYMALEKWFL